MKPNTVLLSGTHTLLRGFLRGWLSRFPDLHVVAEANSALETIDIVKKLKPSLILMDFDTLQQSSLDVLTDLRKNFPKITVIIYFANSHDDLAIKVIRAGAAGFVVKSAAAEEMEAAIKTVMNGGVYLSPDFLRSIGSGVLEKGVPDKQGKILSPRQAEILKLVGLGLTTKAIAFELKISSKTVDVHKQVLMSRLGVDGPIALIKYAIKVGVLPV